MNSSIVNKFAKARDYATEPERVALHQLEVTFRGTNQEHEVRFDAGSWSCDCDFFSVWQTCSHTMAMERMLEPMLPDRSAAFDQVAAQP